MNMNQLERIAGMERALDASSAAVAGLLEALERYAATLPDLKALEAYYQGPLWMRDFEDDRAGRIPPNLKRGVLSEDAVYDLLTDCDRLQKRLRELLGQ